MAETIYIFYNITERRMNCVSSHSGYSVKSRTAGAIRHDVWLIDNVAGLFRMK